MLAGFGAFGKFGYEQAVKEVYNGRGIDVGGRKLKVRLETFGRDEWLAALYAGKPGA